MENGQKIKFGIYDDFIAKITEGYLTIICGGGTGYAIKIESEKDAKEKLNPLLKLSEIETIKHCNDNSWFTYNYYDNILYRHSKVVHKFTKNLNFINTKNEKSINLWRKWTRWFLPI